MKGDSSAAHDRMQALRTELEELFDPQMEEKALSSWHGEVNKVFKGEPHEVATLYALMAMSCAARGELEDARRCVQNGLLHDSDSAQERYQSDYALLLYLGMVYATWLGERDMASQCRSRLEKALESRHMFIDPSRHPKGTTATLLGCPKPNAMIAIWSGSPPQYGRGGKYGEARTILHRNGCEYDILTVQGADGVE